MVTQLPEDDTNSLTRQQMMARLVVAMGGRAAEEKIFGKNAVTSGTSAACGSARHCSRRDAAHWPVTVFRMSPTGASSDVHSATQLARTMVTKYAMSDKVRVASGVGL